MLIKAVSVAVVIAVIGWLYTKRSNKKLSFPSGYNELGSGAMFDGIAPYYDAGKL